MNTALAQHIDQLLIDSGLFNTATPPTAYPSHFNFHEDTILITGAAGTVGSELCQQLLNSTFKQLILIDIAESPLYNLVKALKLEDRNDVKYHLLNINDRDSLNFIFETYKPTIIFHAAAYKHVPLMETHPFEAVKTNIFATKLLADLAITHHASKFIFVSTDKAVNPIGVMGMTKRIAEMHLKHLNAVHKTAFFNTRFGNIVGSNGSVLPLIKSQLEQGHTITLTSKNISRYFICKRKACNLILKIAQFNKTDNVTFTFNMGQPIKIIDITERLAKLYHKDLKELLITYTGLRPGEKQFEAISSENENLQATKHADIFTVIQTNEKHAKQIDFSALKKISISSAHKVAKEILKQNLYPS